MRSRISSAWDETKMKDLYVIYLGESMGWSIMYTASGPLLSPLNKSFPLFISGSHTLASWNPIQTFKLSLSTLFLELLPLINHGVLFTFTAYFPTSFPFFTHWVQESISSYLEYQKTLLTDLPNSWPLAIWRSVDTKATITFIPDHFHHVTFLLQNLQGGKLKLHGYGSLTDSELFFQAYFPLTAYISSIFQPSCSFP